MNPSNQIILLMVLIVIIFTININDVPGHEIATLGKTRKQNFLLSFFFSPSTADFCCISQALMSNSFLTVTKVYQSFIHAQCSIWSCKSINVLNAIIITINWSKSMYYFRERNWGQNCDLGNLSIIHFSEFTKLCAVSCIF